MKTLPVVHGSFTLEREYRVPPSRVFAAWADPEVKAQWFIGPPERWTLVARELDFRVGGRELLHGQLTGGPSTVFTARYHDIRPDERLVYVYDMHVGGTHLSVSLATVELRATRTGTLMRFTEQAAFVDGQDGTRSREGGTAAHFDRLTPVLEKPREVLSERVFDAPRDSVYRAFSDPRQLARWWGPRGATNTFHTFDPRPGGAWRFDMHAADGTRYAMDKEFVEVVPGERVVLRHHQASHAFEMRMDFAAEGERTRVTWRMRFESEQEFDPVRGFVEEANQQNFDRLEAHLAARKDAH
ncbi:SRPBCC domain-containing protein [Myxococcus sp. K15C18031901]|uniref:SRPBCC family protein n=1 Tax=Myxococcus dinghuensis TaxID=2906761 RepID=UPI0020A815DE|nr:SRPBCC family protein [Myxococcus dinghuensis]MCP3099294.1 SRPBCC domain-containing protein [Myxococcus dinghuensis]